jgi:hypothetical protein
MRGTPPISFTWQVVSSVPDFPQAHKSAAQTMIAHKDLIDMFDFIKIAPNAINKNRQEAVKFAAASKNCCVFATI